LTYAYDTRDILVGEWFVSEHRCRSLARELEFAAKESLQIRQRLVHSWTGAEKIRHLIQESGVTDNVARIVQGRDLRPNVPPVELAFIYANWSVFAGIFNCK